MIYFTIDLYINSFHNRLRNSEVIVVSRFVFLFGHGAGELVSSASPFPLELSVEKRGILLT